MEKLYITALAGSVLLLALFVCSIIVFFQSKERVRFLTKEIKRLDGKIADEQRIMASLNADIALEHSSTNVKVLADKHLKANFTSAKQTVDASTILAY